MINTFTSYTTNSGISSTSKIEYLVPSFDSAIKKLRPNVVKWEADSEKFLVWEELNNEQAPSFDEIRAEIRRQSEIYNSYWYYRQRVENYPSIEVQLDMLYHDILDNNLQNGKWISAIRSIKNDYPPGSGTELFFDPPTE
jgi:K+/H+ antiporter YhaU regulatory subunit KhtT